MSAVEQLNVVVLTPGQSVMVNKGSDNEKTVSYEDLVTLLTKRNKSRQSKNGGSLFSRKVNLVEHAVRTGKWTTGAEVDAIQRLEGLLEDFQKLSQEDVANITPNGLDKMYAILNSDKTANLKNRIQDMVNSVVTAQDPVEKAQ